MNITRRCFCFRTFCCVAAPFFDPVLVKANSNVPGTIVDTAREYLRTTDWEPTTSLFSGDTSYFCNEFVADVIRESGGATWKPIERPTLFPLFREPLAREWANSKFKIPNWQVIFDPNVKKNYASYNDILDLRQPGDVVAGGGHVGIVSDDQSSGGAKKEKYVSTRNYLVFSASSSSGAIELNGWSQRIPDVSLYDNRPTEHTTDSIKAVSRFTVRRFID